LQDTYWQVRLRAARALGCLRLPRAVPALIDALSHSMSNLRKEAALALGEIGVPEALPALERIKDDRDPEVRKSARLAIAQIHAAGPGVKILQKDGRL
jgi:HEAT repeat protein